MEEAQNTEYPIGFSEHGIMDILFGTEMCIEFVRICSYLLFVCLVVHCLFV